MENMFDQEDLQIIERFKEENILKKNAIIEEYQVHDVPTIYKKERAQEAPTYELYIMNKIEFSPADEEEISKLGEDIGKFERVRHLKSQVMSSDDWYRSVYGRGFFEQFNINELSWYFYDAAILTSKVESAAEWMLSLDRLSDEKRKKGRFLLWILAFCILSSVIEFRFYKSFQRGSIYLLAAIAIGYLVTKRNKKKKAELEVISKERQEAETCLDWLVKKANEHPLVQQQGEQSSTFFFDTMRNYVNEGRAKTVQEALNLYHQESQYNQLIREQEEIRRQTAHINKMTTFNTIYNVLKK